MLFSLAPAVALVVVAEVLSRLTISRQGRVTRDTATNRSVYVMRVGFWPWSRRTRTPLNSLGLPDEEFPQPGDPKRCRHVVFAGDSFTFGDGVDRDSNYVEVVRRRLSARDTVSCVRVFNLGERGTTIDRQIKRILETVDRLRPDLVILGQYQNDLTDLRAPGAILGPPMRPGEQPARRGVPEPRAAFNASSVKLLAYRSTAFMIERGIKRDQLAVWSVMADSTKRPEAQRLQEVYGRLFAQLADALARRNIEFGVVIIPSKLDVLAGRYPEEQFFVALAEQHRVPYLRTFPTFHERRTPYAFLVYDGHLSEHGNRLLGDAVYAWMTAQPPPFLALGGSPGTDAGPGAGGGARAAPLARGRD